jgi:hypothetical protein
MGILDQRYFLVLLVCLELKSKKQESTRQVILDLIEWEDLYNFSEDDFKFTEIYRQAKWKTDISTAASQLASFEDLNNFERGYWEITEQGIGKLRRLSKKINLHSPPYFLTPKLLEKAKKLNLIN